MCLIKKNYWIDNSKIKKFKKGVLARIDFEDENSVK